ncbi:MAG: class I adenylate-forming enzyme family protein [Bacilli bacterium]|nr:class I adenylate-forming enzyme family protein [Bacilli bacterium]
MDKDVLKKLKLDLADAIKRKDFETINLLRNILNISDEQAKYFDKGLTGYPSIDKVWLKYYKEDAEEKANSIPVNKTVWDVIEEKLIEYYDIPALEYFGKVFSKQEFIDLCYIWARTFRAMGVEENEVVPVYGPFVPDICAMVFGLNMIGACPYFLKLAISKQALEEETRDSKIAVVYDGMWQNVAHEFSKDKFKNVIIATVTADMPSPKKEIVSFISKIQAIKNKSKIPNEKKYIWTDKAREIANYYSGNIKVPFVSNRPAFITSSSGTTVDGIVKGTVATNESTLSQLYMSNASGIQYFKGDKCLCPYPPTASTSLNVMFLMSLFQGLTVLLDPRISLNDFYRQIIELRPNIVLTTGSMWELFFNKIDSMMKSGKKFDFSYAKGWTVGGEGTDCHKFQKWNEIMRQANAYNLLFSGYGSSELFSATSVETIDARYDFSKQIMSVGIPYAGIIMKVVNDNNEEVSYNQRGELKIKSKSAMKEYYNKPKITLEVKSEGWIKTGDLAEIDENGFIYIWGRVSDSIKLLDGNKLYLFDVANIIKENNYIDDAIVLSMPTDENENNLVAHIVWSSSVLEKNKKDYIEQMNDQLNNFLPSEVELSAYKVHEKMLPFNPITLKKDKNGMQVQTSGYIQVIDGEITNIEFKVNKNEKYTKEYGIIRKNRRRILKRE